MASSSCQDLSEIDVTDEIEEMRKGVVNYEPGNTSSCPDPVEFPKSLIIGLFGRTGCGKTSLINSLKFAAHGKLRRPKWLQVATQEKAGGHTMFRKLADITEKIYVVDNRGLDDPNDENAIREIAEQLDGRRGYSEIIKWQVGNADKADNAEKEGDAEKGSEAEKGDYVEKGSDAEKGSGPGELVPNHLLDGHAIGCAVFVFSASHDMDTNSTGLIEVIDFLHGHQGCYPVAVITHVDTKEGNAVESLKTVLRIAGVSDIFEVANITTSNKSLGKQYQHSLLSLLERCMTDGDATLIFKHYQRRQREIEHQRGEIRRTKEQERQAEEDRQNDDRERVERENEMRQLLEQHRLEIERHRERAAEIEREKQEEVAELERVNREQIAELEREKREQVAELERERRENERERRHEEDIRKLKTEQQEAMQKERELRHQEAIQNLSLDKQNELQREKQEYDRERRQQEDIGRQREAMFKEKEQSLKDKISQVTTDNDKDLKRMIEANKRTMATNESRANEAIKRAEKADQQVQEANKRAVEATKLAAVANKDIKEANKKREDATDEAWRATARATDAERKKGLFHKLKDWATS